MRKIITRLFVMLLVFSFVLTLAPALSPSGSLQVDFTQAMAAKKPSLSVTSKTLSVGQSVTLTVKNAGSKTVKWSSSDKDVAAVSNKGVVKAVAPGKATITAKIGSKKLKAKITVVKGYTVSAGAKSVTVENGESETISVNVVPPKEGEDWSLVAESDNKYICTASVGQKEGNKVPVSVTGTGAGVATVSVYVKGHPETAQKITVEVSMSLEEITKSLSVKYIADREFMYYDNEDIYVLLFSLKDSSLKRVDAPAKVDIRIENKGEVVYERTRYVTLHDFGTWTNTFSGDKYLASVRISPKDIKEGTTDNGTVYFTVSSDLLDFGESKVSASELPKKDITKSCSLKAPKAPLELSYGSSRKKYTTVRLTKIKYKFEEYYNGKVKLIITFSGEKIYDYRNRNDSCSFEWKLYDKKGYVVDSGTFYTDSLSVGEKFKNKEKTIYDLAPGKYTLKLTNHTW